MLVNSLWWVMRAVGSLPPSLHFFLRHSTLTQPRLSLRSQSPLLSEETCSMNDSWLHCSHISLYLINYALIYQADEQHMLILEAKGQRWVSWRWNDELCFANLGLQRVYSPPNYCAALTEAQTGAQKIYIFLSTTTNSISIYLDFCRFFYDHVLCTHMLVFVFLCR